jgi:hypothetical protein
MSVAIVCMTEGQNKVTCNKTTLVSANISQENMCEAYEVGYGLQILKYYVFIS